MSLTRKLATDVLIVTLVNGAKQLRSLLFIVLLTSTFGIGVYGAYAQLIAIVGISTFVFGLGLQTALVRHAQYEGYDISVLYSSCLFPALISGLIAAICIFVFASGVSSLVLGTSRFTFVFLVGAVLIPTRIILTLGENFFRAQMRTKLGSILQAVRAYLVVGTVAIVIFYCSASIEQVILTIVLVEVSVAILIHIAIFVSVGFSIPSVSLITHNLRYSLPLAGSFVANNVSSRADRLLIGSFLGAGPVGIYDVAYRIASVVMIYSQPVMDAFFPEFSRLLENDEHDRCKIYIKNGVRYFQIFVIPSILGLWLINDSLIPLVTSEIDPYSTQVLIPVLACGISFWGLNRLYGVILVADERTTQVLAIRGVAAVLNIVLNIILIPMIGIFGAAMATLTSYVLSSIGVYYYSNQVVESGFSLSTAGRALFSSSIMSVTIWYLIPGNLIYILVTAPVVYFIAMVSVGGIRKEELVRLLSWLPN